ncbi:hypothetical protein NARC_140095 [Candidatus Nitrosocosmicus arcticus]|uniref:Uncharacterized protein n=1 Tax=Candidatus Nitrosocosmicus arcticus TaxID=2035267 RepID=A0A557SSR8_9ARCH|nr:hypothetical protein NARC_140095 [Candidatus Nitrosocosmicus arcticus]
MFLSIFTFIRIDDERGWTNLDVYNECTVFFYWLRNVYNNHIKIEKFIPISKHFAYHKTSC